MEIIVVVEGGSTPPDDRVPDDRVLVLRVITGYRIPEDDLDLGEIDVELMDRNTNFPPELKQAYHSYLLKCFVRDLPDLSKNRIFTKK